MLLHIMVLVLTNTKSYKSDNVPGFTRYEYGNVSFNLGTRQEGDEVTYNVSGVIPKYKPHFYHIIDKSVLRKDLEKNFTYLTVEYINKLSRIDIQFDKKVYMISFFTYLPFLVTTYTVIAYALPPLSTFYMDLAIDAFNYSSSSMNTDEVLLRPLPI